MCYEHQSIFCNCFLKFPFSAVTLDYKALLLLLNKKNDEDFLLGGKGYGVEFCVFCDAIRVPYLFAYKPSDFSNKLN